MMTKARQTILEVRKQKIDGFSFSVCCGGLVVHLWIEIQIGLASSTVGGFSLLSLSSQRSLSE
jgi:hypothetical protein